MLPSATASSTPVTVTVCGVFQLALVCLLKFLIVFRNSLYILKSPSDLKNLKNHRSCLACCSCLVPLVQYLVCLNQQTRQNYLVEELIVERPRSYNQNWVIQEH